MSKNQTPLGIKFLFYDSSSEAEEEVGDIWDQEGALTDFTLLPGRIVRIREFTFHTHNANFIWKGNELFAQWVIDNKNKLVDKRILELASATGILSIFMKQEGLDITSSDYDDPIIQENIEFNMELNQIEKGSVQYIPYNWGSQFDESYGAFDVVIANDIIIYEASYPLLASSIVMLSNLLMKTKGTILHFYLGNTRRVKTNLSLFDIMKQHNFECEKVGSSIYDFYMKSE